MLDWALDTLKPLQKSHPEITTSERDHPFTECATWADEIKDEGGMWQFNWHFINSVYLDEGGTLDDYDFTPPDTNVVEALESLTGFLKGQTLDEKHQYYMDTIA